MKNRPVGLLPTNSARDLGSIALGWLFPRMGGAASIASFEEQFERKMGGGGAFTFAAGRVSLLAILTALEIEPGDEVILPGYTCVAVPNPIIFMGARPIYVDIDPETLNICVKSLDRAISKRTRAVIVQHTFGYPASALEISELIRGRGIALIEDCTHALGATLNNKLVGNFGDAAFFSLEQTKMISAGAGGIAFTRNPALGGKIKRFQERCAEPLPATTRKLMAYLGYQAVGRDPRWSLPIPQLEYYLHRVGLVHGPVTTDQEMRCERPANFEQILSGAQARVARAQLGQLHQNLARRREIADIYSTGLNRARFSPIKAPPNSAPSFVRFPIRVKNKNALAEDLRRQAIQLGQWFTAPVHPLGVPQELAGYHQGSCPNAEQAVLHIANLPCHPRMNSSDAVRVVEAVLNSQYA